MAVSTILILALYSLYFWPFIINFWLKDKFWIDLGFWNFLALINLLIGATYSIFINYFTIRGNVLFILKIEFITVLLNVIISIYSVKVLGGVGAIIGTTSQFLLSSFLIYRYIFKNYLFEFSSIYTTRFYLFLLSGITLFVFVRFSNLSLYSNLMLLSLFTIHYIFTIKFDILKLNKKWLMNLSTP
jgi:hypothetical protein